MFRNAMAFALWGLLSLAAMLAVGCGQKASQPAQPAPASQVAAEDHGGWWCVEHGVPEDECSICSSKAAESFKAKGDWCEEHNRAESQCFLCSPARAEKFAKLYEAKFGKKPPKREDEK